MTEPRHSDRSLNFLFWVVAIGWCVLPLVLIAYTGTAKEILSDFGTQTSGLSSMTITAVDWLTGNHPSPGAMALPGLVYVAPLWFVPLVCVYLLLLRPGKRGPASVLLLAMTVLLVAAVGAVTLALTGDVRALAASFG